MQKKKFYRINFISGELAGRSFAVPPEGVQIGKSRGAAIRPGGADIEIEHAALYVREADGALMLTSQAETVFVAEKQLPPGAETVLEPAAEVRLGKNLIFTAEEDTALPAPPAVPDDDDEATEDETEDDAAAVQENEDEQTRYASPDELNDLRRFSQKQSKRQKLSLAAGFVLLLLIVAGGYLFHEFRQENPLTWPGELSNQYNDGEFRIHLPPHGKFLIYYPECRYTRVQKNGDNCEVLTLLGKNLEVLFHLKLEVNALPDGYVLSRKESFARWRARAEKESGFTFLTQPEQRFYATSTCGIPYQIVSYKRRDKQFQWQGLACYLRYHDREIVFIREVPVQHYWRAEKVLNQYGCFVASPDAANSYWEIPEKMPETVVKTDLYRSLLTEMMDNVAVADWPELNRRFAVLLSQSGKSRDESMMKDALELLRELRERQDLWYSQACLAYQHYEQNENWAMMRHIRSECLAKFPSPNDYRYTKIIRNIWTVDE